MAISKDLKLKIKNLTTEEVESFIKMAIADKVSFDDIKQKYNFSPGEVEKVLLKEIGQKRFKRWKLRREKRSTNKGRPRQDLA